MRGGSKAEHLLGLCGALAAAATRLGAGLGAARAGLAVRDALLGSKDMPSRAPLKLLI